LGGHADVLDWNRDLRQRLGWWRRGLLSHDDGHDDGRDDGWSDVEDNRCRIGWREACIGRSDSNYWGGWRRVERRRDRICDQYSNRCECPRRHPRLGAGGEFGMRRLHPVS
jgi:hypothetical protein